MCVYIYAYTHIIFTWKLIIIKYIYIYIHTYGYLRKILSFKYRFLDYFLKGHNSCIFNLVETPMKHKACQILIMLNKEAPNSFFAVYTVGPGIFQHFITSDQETGISKVGFF